MSGVTYSPGSLVRARGREWIVLTGSDRETLRVRPISGSEEDQTLIHLRWRPSQSPRPPSRGPTHASAPGTTLHCSCATRCSCRCGAAPARSAASGRSPSNPAPTSSSHSDGAEARPVRLLIADDVGVGKTIEAALIARELLDRGDIERLAVLCPPHLVEQWVGELEARFHIHAVAVTAASASRLERSLPPSESIFSACPHTVVSLDYIKSERRAPSSCAPAPSS
jgi:hypothetical protein